MTKNELESDLRDLPDVRQISVVGNGTLVATVVAGSFSGQNEAERQEAVWKLLHSRHESHQLQNVEFIFTNAPGE
ncbi:MAG TPA: hypothetical protein VIV60_23610 [Polyangiaceae bacterium]